MLGLSVCFFVSWKHGLNGFISYCCLTCGTIDAEDRVPSRYP